MNGKDEETISRILETIENKQSFFIFSHINPDGDSIGSQLALHIILKRIGKTTCMFSTQKAYPQYTFLPSSAEIKSEIPADANFEVAIVLDCASADLSLIHI